MPVVLAVSSMIFILLTIMVSMNIRSRQTERLWWEGVQAGYAAESGMEVMKTRLRERPEADSGRFRLGEYLVEVKAERKTGQLRLRAVATGPSGIRKSAEAELDPASLVIQRRIR